MKITIEPTNDFIVLQSGENALPARCWQGVTDEGISVICAIPVVITEKKDDVEKLDKDVLIHRAMPLFQLVPIIDLDDLRCQIHGQDAAAQVMSNFDIDQKSIMPPDEQKNLIERAMPKITERFDQPVTLETNFRMIFYIIGQLHLAFRHPKNKGWTRDAVESFTRGMIEYLDPARGDIYNFMMMGFDSAYDHADAPVEDETEVWADVLDEKPPLEGVEQIPECRKCGSKSREDIFCNGCGEQICRVCGCTNSAACNPPCFWIRPGVCSSCSSKA